MMGPKELNLYVRARPFVPFKIVMVSGESYNINHPEMIAVGKRTSHVFDWDRRTEAYDKATLLSYTLMERLELTEAARVS